MKGYFITGTDTGAGKTYATVLLTQYFIAQGYKVAALKPVASGAQWIEGRWRNDDALQLQAASNVDMAYDNINPYCLRAPASPHIAAQQDGVVISLETIKATVQHVRQTADIVLVEGVGGWYAPLTEKFSVADLAANLQLPVIMVVGLRLGCMNHAILTARAIKSSGSLLAGWIASVVDPQYADVEATQQYLVSRIDAPFIGMVSHQAGFSSFLI